jgi:DNA-binding winged helix-turn-helix (wHTH) protein
MRLTFGECVLDTEARLVTRRDQDVHLPPKAFDLLQLLIECRPRAVSKAELLDRLWPGVFVSEASLAKVVSGLRDALGDDGTPIIRTVHGHGYAFAAAVTALDSGGLLRQRSAICWLFCGSREFALPDGEHLIGRDPDATVCLQSGKVSRRHARIVVSGIRAVIEDLASKNGSFVRGERIVRPTALSSGDDVRVGPFILLFRTSVGVASTESEV